MKAEQGKNDGYIYGKSELFDLMKVPVEQWPTRQEEAVARLDTGAYAFVNNDNPKDRLHLREKPDRKAKSLGKFTTERRCRFSRGTATGRMCASARATRIWRAT